jgi:ATP-dependent Lhr-like helicase
MNVGTIVEAPMLRVRLGRRLLGEIEEYFVQGLVPGDSFVFAGERLCFEGIEAMEVMTSRSHDELPPKVPAYEGGRLPLTTHLAARVRGLLASPDTWPGFPEPVREWLSLQLYRSELPDRDGLLVETFPRGPHHYLVAYCFEGRNAHQTLAVWSLEPARDLDELFDQDMLGDDLEVWMAESSMLRRSFRNVAVIAGLIDRQLPGHEKSRRQVTFNSDLIYDTLRRFEPDHVLLRATVADAATGLTDVRRLADMLARVKGRIRHRALDRVSPLAVPVLLEIGREAVYGAALDRIVDDALLEEAGLAPARAND